MRLIDADKIPWDVEGVGTIPVVTKEEIDNMPTIDAEPVRHGYKRFIVNTRTESLKVGCSLCGYEYKSKIGDIHKYCPCCGAKMDGQEDTGKNL